MRKRLFFEEFYVFRPITLAGMEADKIRGGW
jgi:hypothetical protein